MPENKRKVYRYISMFLHISFAGLCACTQTTGGVDTAIHYHAKSEKDGKKNPFIIAIQKGDTVYDLAQEHGVSVRELIDGNGLRPPYNLLVGQKVRLPKPAYHVVKSQDTLYAIARSYDIDMDSLMQANNLHDPSALRAGEKLRMPSKVNTQKDDGNYREKPVVVTQSEEVQKAAPYGVRSGELNSVSSRPSVPTHISSKPLVSHKAKTKKTSASFSQARPVPSLKSRNHGVSTQSKARSAASSQKVNFYWPVRGKVISRFGPKSGGLYNDGINIRASEGTPIKAAADGKVVYAGNELKGYGNLLLVKHDNGFLTAYAHTQRNAVAKGDHVSRGQVIGYVGKTGHVKNAQLHFSIRQGRKAFDPEKFLSSSYSMR
jgi:murein DD-endopeptidase MepM/ murein hydrolase activator NlpD